MRYQTPLVVVMVVAIAATLGITTISATNLTTQNSPITENFALAIGHVELIVRNADGNIVSYFQADNAVTNIGDRCASERLFKTNAPENDEACGDAVFDVIGIINGTGLSEGITTVIGDYIPAGTSGGSTNVMATIPDTVVTVGATADGVVTTITNSGHLFNFESTGNENATTTVNGVILLDGACTENANGDCNTLPTAAIFAARDATLTVNDGDTLQVTWTITVG